MYKVMLVDDDYPVIEFLQQTIPWEEIGLSVTGAFTDGESALARAKEQMPDILLTDIGMPKMNGLELIAHLQTLNPDIRCVILSCHDEFEYAQQAVRLGVNDYLLKETMTEETIVETLNDVRQALHEQRKKSGEFAYLKRLATQDFSVLMGSLNATGYQKRFMRDMGIDFERHAYVPVLVSVDLHRSALCRFQTDELLLYAIQNVAEEMVEKDRPGIVCFRHLSLGVILLIPSDPSVIGLLHRVQRRIQQYLSVNVSCLLEKACHTADELQTTLNRLLKAATGLRFYLAENRVVDVSAKPLRFSEDNLFTAYATAYDDLYRVMLSEDIDLLERTLSAQVEMIREKRYQPTIVKEWFLKLLLDMQLKVVTAPFPNHQRVDPPDVLHTAIEQINSLEELHSFASEFMRKMVELIREMRQQPTNLEVVKAQQYVLKHVDKKITQEEVAGMLHLNTSYFSRLFKRETGVNFSRYVMAMKMERAKEYLRTSNKTVDDISLSLGYENKGYFFKLFKLYTGMTPAQYAGQEQVL